MFIDESIENAEIDHSCSLECDGRNINLVILIVGVSIIEEILFVKFGFVY